MPPSAGKTYGWLLPLPFFFLCDRFSTGGNSAAAAAAAAVAALISSSSPCFAARREALELCDENIHQWQSMGGEPRGLTERPMWW